VTAAPVLRAIDEAIAAVRRHRAAGLQTPGGASVAGELDRLLARLGAIARLSPSA
jgi:hypothetical protein